MPRFIFSEEFLVQCRKRMEEKNYLGITESFGRSGLISVSTIKRYFGSCKNFIQVIGIPLCRLQHQFRVDNDEDILHALTYFSRRHGEMKIISSKRKATSYTFYLENGLSYKKGILSGYVDLQIYTKKRIEVQEFFKINRMIESSAYRAKTKGFAHNLSVYDIYEMYNFELPQTCSVLGSDLGYYNSKFQADSASLDKINPALGYTKGNVRIISYAANTWCSNMTKEQKLAILKDSLAEDEEVIIRKKRNTLLRKVINLETTNS